MIGKPVYHAHLLVLGNLFSFHKQQTPVSGKKQKKNIIIWFVPLSIYEALGLRYTKTDARKTKQKIKLKHPKKAIEISLLLPEQKKVQEN